MKNNDVSVDVLRRLKLFYGEKSNLQLEETAGGGTTIAIYIEHSV